MYEDFKFALDKIFLFMLVVSITIFAINFAVKVDPRAIHAIESIDLAVLGGYYFVFGRGLYQAKRKVKYVKQHWIMLVLLLLPFLPVARIARIINVERVFAISSNTLWHVLDEIGLL